MAFKDALCLKNYADITLPLSCFPFQFPAYDSQPSCPPNFPCPQLPRPNSVLSGLSISNVLLTAEPTCQCLRCLYFLICNRLEDFETRDISSTIAIVCVIIHCLNEVSVCELSWSFLCNILTLHKTNNLFPTPHESFHYISERPTTALNSTSNIKISSYTASQDHVGFGTHSMSRPVHYY